MTASDHSYESPQDRASLAREAGLGRLSFPSILAGVLVAYGGFAVLAALVGAVAASQADAEAIRGSLRSLGIPTTGTEWGKAGTVAGIGSLAAMLLGALLGGVFGERWHSKLTRRAVSGKYRPNRDDQPAERDHDRLAHDQTLDQRDRPRPDRQGDTGATRITDTATQESTAKRTDRLRRDR
jgi:hypothetical protein